ncbi:gliding motility-associated C-terminal domain-containing protein [Owenweeksia hongkongensis]|uniref:T9SS type B sorting domain-containing protein n=1 Tax=Owenweeksia hongkongensis TaxID=253245 RepID=UPI003A934B2E
MTRILSFLFLVTALVSCIEAKDSTVAPYGIFIPNAFSPNGDGVNDILKPVFPTSTPPLQSYSFEIYDGDLIQVFNTTDTSKAWDGKSSNGKTLPEATYYFNLNGEYVTGEKYEVSGGIALIRP